MLATASECWTVPNRRTCVTSASFSRMIFCASTTSVVTPGIGPSSRIEPGEHDVDLVSDTRVHDSAGENLFVTARRIPPRRENVDRAQMIFVAGAGKHADPGLCRAMS